MRNKTLLLTAALGLLGATSSFAQVYSVNAVGYVNQTIAGAGYLLIENPLNNGDNSIGTVIPSAVEGSIVQGWDTTLQDFKDPSSYLGGTWFKPDFSTSTEVLAPGTGFFFYSADASTTTFVGDVPQGDNLTVTLQSQYNLVGSIVPQSASFEVLGLNAVAGEGDIAQFWNADLAVQDFFPPLSRLGTDWYTPEFAVVAPTPAVGEAFFYYRASEGSANWTRSFHVNP